MIYINNIDRIKEWNNDNIYFITDFDHTLTLGSSESSWGVLTNCKVLPDDYEAKRKALKDYYYPIEMDLSIDVETKNRLMNEWWEKHISLLIEYQFKEKMFFELLKNNPVMFFREGAKELLYKLSVLNIPVIIISAGLGDFIVDYLKINECYYDNIHVVANFFSFKDGIASMIKGNIIHSMNKNEVSLPDQVKNKLINRPNAILLGDNIADIKMINENNRNNALKIGFLDYKIDEYLNKYLDNYDIVCTDNASINDLLDELKKVSK